MKIQASPVFHSSFEAMATTFEIWIAGLDKVYAGQAAEAAFDKIKHIESLLNLFDPGSEIGRINRLRPGQSMRIGVEVFECLRLSVRIHEITQGAFDISLGSLLEYGHDLLGKSIQKPFGREFLPFDLSASKEGFKIRIRENASEKTILDLGGIGKGFALDKTLEVLSDWDIENMLIHGGTSTALARGYAEGPLHGWPVGVGGDWKCPAMPVSIILHNRSLSGSGTEVKGKHIYDPKNGSPAEGHKSVWVSYPSASFSDALSTAFMVMNTDQVIKFCKKNTDVWTYLVTPDEEFLILNKDRVKTNEN
jgi:thiamine biosynthesis lipoprotein